MYAKSVLITSKAVPVKLPPHEAKWVTCRLKNDQWETLRAADQGLRDQARGEYNERVRAAKLKKQPISKATFGSYFSKASPRGRSS